MTPALAMFIFNGMTLTSTHRLLLMLPLCLSIAVVYKTTRCHRLAEIPLASVLLWGTILLGMAFVGLVMWGLFTILVRPA